ncbi:Rieske (2Fe-2S) protein [Cohnella algarum]|uniref:Rieske (2Fe-2S) protein n=1 Tax=Cohnella algarum TaxID=2044859 RepID=UPI001966D696|nr:Rieske (2Fe-2S) protein [Cohnella algarum]MBN2983517.1 Rieske (2Fe-2S) protein [Cohnella algarum]
MRQVVCKADEMACGEKRAVQIGTRSLVLVRTNDGDYCALLNACPHQGARLSDGDLTGTTLPSSVGEYVFGRESEVLRCPWHRWEFDVKSGNTLFPDRRACVKRYEVTIEEGDVVIHY